jgi:hypothetical protein
MFLSFQITSNCGSDNMYHRIASVNAPFIESNFQMLDFANQSLRLATSAIFRATSFINGDLVDTPVSNFFLFLARKLTGENLNVAWFEFSTLSQSILLNSIISQGILKGEVSLYY